MATDATIDAGQQHLKALRHANRVRLARAEMKRKVAAGQLAVADVIRTCPWQAQRMEISELLMSQKRWGRARCRRLLLSIGVPENKPMGTLTERQRVALCDVLEAKALSYTAAQVEASTFPSSTGASRNPTDRVLTAV